MILLCPSISSPKGSLICGWLPYLDSLSFQLASVQGLEEGYYYTEGNKVNSASF